MNELALSQSGPATCDLSRVYPQPLCYPEQDGVGNEDRWVDARLVSRDQFDTQLSHKLWILVLQTHRPCIYPAIKLAG